MLCQFAATGWLIELIASRTHSADVARDLAVFGIDV